MKKVQLFEVVDQRVWPTRGRKYPALSAALEYLNDAKITRVIRIEAPADKAELIKMQKLVARHAERKGLCLRSRTRDGFLYVKKVVA